MIPTVLSLILFESKDPPTTAMRVAKKCQNVAQQATPMGFCAAPNATVANMLRSPHSAMKIKVNVSTNAVRSGPRCAVDLHTTSVASASSPCSYGVDPVFGISKLSFKVLIPKNNKSAQAAYSTTGNVVINPLGSF